MGLNLSSDAITGIDPNDYAQFLFKFVVCGDYGVGKSCIVQRFAKNEFSDNHESTIGVEIVVRTFVLDQNKIKVQLWDTTGQERYRCVTKSYYRGAHGIIVVYDVTNRASFDNVEIWVNEINDNGRSRTLKALVGNQCDLEDKKVVSFMEGKDLADKLGMSFLEVSAKDGTNIEQTFVSLASDLIHERGDNISNKHTSNYIRISDNTSQITSKINNCCKMS